MHFEAHTVPSGADYDDDNVLILPFTTVALQLHFRSGTNPVYFSFNGTDNHGVLHDTGDYRRNITLDPLRINKFWFKGASGNEIIEITALPAI